MRGIRGWGTAPERAVERALKMLEISFRKQVNGLRGRPDFVLPPRKLVLFVHGCFWHRHKGCPQAATPATRPAFWRGKFAANIARDRRTAAWLRTRGWSVRTLWECQLAGIMEQALQALVCSKVRVRSGTAARRPARGTNRPAGARGC